MSPRRDLDRLSDMRAALSDIRQLTAGGREPFEADRSGPQAVAYNLAVLGEAARAGVRVRCANATRKCPGAT